MFARLVAFSSSLAGLAAFAALAACYGPGEDAAEAKVCVAHAKLSSSELSSPPVDFAADVAPLFAQSCAFSSCHGSKGSAGNHGLFLGAKNADEIALAKSGLAGASRALPSMPYVTPGDPEKSFVMRKLDGDTCVFDSQCEGGSCGKSMPSGNDLLPEATRDVVRRWIAQGAK